MFYIDVPSEVYEALRDFGYKSFRPGQEAAIMRILSGWEEVIRSLKNDCIPCFADFIFMDKLNAVIIVFFI